MSQKSPRNIWKWSMADTQIVMMPYSCWHIAVAGAFHFEAFLKERKIAARYRIHWQMTEKTGTSTNCCMQLLKMFPKFNQRQFPNIATGNETWVHSFEPVWKIGNKWPVVAKRTARKLKEGSLYSIFFSCDCIAYKFRCRGAESGKGVTCRCYPYILLKKFMQFEKY